MDRQILHFRACFRFKLGKYTAQNMKFSMKDFFSKCDQIRKKLRIWSNLLKKSLMENFNFCDVINFDPNIWFFLSHGCNDHGITILKFYSKTSALFCSYNFTAWKVFKYGVISGPYFPAFGLNTKRYGAAPGNNI